MINKMYIELAASVILVLVTLAAVLVISWATKRAKRMDDKPKCRILIYYQPGCECFEFWLERLINSSVIRGFDGSITVVDCVGSPESERWLNALRSKLDYCFEIQSQGGGENGT